MKRVLLSAWVLMVGWGMAAPNPARVPAGADVVFVLDGLNERLPFPEEVLREVLGSFPICAMAPGEDGPNPIQALFGVLPQGSNPLMTAKSVTLAVTLPERLEVEMVRGNIMERISIYLTIESPGVTLEEFMAMTQAPENGNVREGEWWVNHSKHDPEGFFFAIREVPEGFLYAITMDRAEAEALAEGKGSIVGSGSPLLAAFERPKEARGPLMTVCIGSVKGIVQRLEPELLARVTQQVPQLLQVGAATTRVFLTDREVRAVQTLEAETLAATGELSEGLVTLKMLARQALRNQGPSPQGNTLVDLISAVRISTLGTQARLNLNLPFSRLLEVLRAFELIQHPAWTSDVTAP